MAAFKSRGILVLSILVFVILTAINVIKGLIGWQTGPSENAIIAGVTVGVLVLILRRYGFHPFARKPTP